MKIISYSKAIAYLEGFIGKIVFNVDNKSVKQHDPLDRMRIFLSLLGNPQNKFKSVLVGGTSGKGSTAYLLSRILTKAGCKTGFTLSPHLQKANERLQINEKEIPDKQFIKLVNLVKPVVEGMKNAKIGAPSYFEILIAMAFLYFAEKRVDIAVAEVGMGGEFDATNTLNPLIAVLTNVGLDHMNILGNTVEKIAETKAGIIKRINDKGLINNSSLIINHLTVISGVRQPSVIKIIEDRSKDVGAELRLLWRDFGYKVKKENISGIEFDFISQEEILDDIKLSLLGQYQAENASLAIKTVLELRKLGFKIADEVIRRALKSAFFPGRFEIIKVARGPVKNKLKIILDGAHNPIKMKEFLKTLKKIFPTQKKTFIIGFKFDKDIPKMLKQIVKVADEIIVTEFNRATDMNMNASARALMIKDKLLRMKYREKIIVKKDSKKALKMGIKTIQQFNDSAILVVTGSLYLVGEIRNRL